MGSSVSCSEVLNRSKVKDSSTASMSKRSTSSFNPSSSTSGGPSRSSAAGGERSTKTLSSYLPTASPSPSEEHQDRLERHRRQKQGEDALAAAIAGHMTTGVDEHSESVTMKVKVMVTTSLPPSKPAAVTNNNSQQSGLLHQTSINNDAALSRESYCPHCKNNLKKFQLHDVGTQTTQDELFEDYGDGKDTVSIVSDSCGKNTTD